MLGDGLYLCIPLVILGFIDGVWRAYGWLGDGITLPLQCNSLKKKNIVLVNDVTNKNLSMSITLNMCVCGWGRGGGGA